jgi:hypothetical protein
MGSGWYRDGARWTHGDPRAYDVTRRCGDLVEMLLDDWSVERAAAAVGFEIDSTAQPAAIAPGHDCESAVRGGLLIAATCTDVKSVRESLFRAREAPVPSAVGPVAGALLGVIHGVEALPIDLLARMELTWVVDTLARDLVAQLTEHPGDGPPDVPRHAMWATRYPPG